MAVNKYCCTVVSRKYAPPFCNLSLSTKPLHAGCDNDYALYSGKAWPHCRWGYRVGPSARQRDAPDASSEL